MWYTSFFYSVVFISRAITVKMIFLKHLSNLGKKPIRYKYCSDDVKVSHSEEPCHRVKGSHSKECDNGIALRYDGIEGSTSKKHYDGIKATPSPLKVILSPEHWFYTFTNLVNTLDIDFEPHYTL